MGTQQKIRAFLHACFIQLCCMGVIFLGGLLDPLMGLWIAIFYFFVIGTYSIYRCLITRPFYKP